MPDAKKELAALGFRQVDVRSVDGRQVVVEANWLVTVVEGAGAPAPLSTRVVILVDKPKPTDHPTPVDTPSPEPSPEPLPEPEPVPEPKPEPQSVYYSSCAAAKAAGAAPLHAGEPGYRPALDGDRDGVACDK